MGGGRAGGVNEREREKETLNGRRFWWGGHLLTSEERE